MKRLMLVATLALLCLAATACPKPKQGDDAGQQASSAQSTKKEMPERSALVKTNPITTIEKLVNAMNKNDLEGYKLLLAADGPAYDKMLTKFNEFDSSKARITLDDVSVQSQQDTTATVIYDLKTEFTTGGAEPEYEHGRFKMRFVDSQWVIWDIDAVPHAS